MWYTYGLISLKNKRLYIGFTSNLRRRVREHNMGHGSVYTTNNKAFKLIFYEAFLTKDEAKNKNYSTKQDMGERF